MQFCKLKFFPSDGDPSRLCISSMFLHLKVSSYLEAKGNRQNKEQEDDKQKDETTRSI